MASLNADGVVANYLKEVKFNDWAPELQPEVLPEYPTHHQFNVDEILKSEAIKKDWPTFLSDLIESPVEVIKLWEAEIKKFVCDTLTEDDDDEGDDDYDELQRTCKIYVGFFLENPKTRISDIRSETIGKYVTIEGAVVKSSGIQTMCTQMTFKCLRCETVIVKEQPDGIYKPPITCPNTDCKGKPKFDYVETASTTVVIDFITLKIQDLLSNAEPGSIPVTIECRLLGDLVKICNTGDAVTISGVVKTRQAQENKPGLLTLYIDVGAVKNNKDMTRSMGGNVMNFTDKDYYAVKAIHSTPDLFRFLIYSFCPSIFGHELVKAGLLLSLFGGRKYENEASKRSDINVLMVGDPGLGKSQMLKMVSEVAPKGVFVCGSSSTTCGLTVTLNREGDDVSFEAGAMVLAHNGVCCIDEFDKMTTQHKGLLEAMEQQCVSVCKAGFLRTFPTRTTVVAAGNPVEGHYNTGKTIRENIKIEAPLLSRFDLIYVIIDKPDEEMDRKLFEHIRDLRRTAKPQSAALTTVGTSATQLSPIPVASASGLSQKNTAQKSNAEFVFKTPRPVDQLSNDQPLSIRLKPRKDEKLDLLPHLLLRKYIAYAKMYVHPKLDEEAGDFLFNYFKSLRSSRSQLHSLPVTVRQLESLVRLTEARAKVELREVATLEDAKDVVEIFEFSIAEVSRKPVEKQVDFPVQSSSTGSGKSTKKSATAEAKSLLTKLQETALKTDKWLFSTSEVRQMATDLNLVTNFSGLLARLNYEGYIIKKHPNTYQLRSNSF